MSGFVFTGFCSKGGNGNLQSVGKGRDRSHEYDGEGGKDLSRACC